MSSPEEKKRALAERYRYKPMGVAYQGALESVFAIAIATTAGYFADDYFGTSPWLLIAGATIGFAAFVLRLTRLGSALNRAASAQEPPADDPDASGEKKPDAPRD